MKWGLHRNFRITEIYRNFAKRFGPFLSICRNWPKFYRNFAKHSLPNLTEISRNLKNSWTIPLKIVNLLIFIKKNRLEIGKVTKFLRFYLKFCQIWEISEYRTSDFFSGISRNFAKQISSFGANPPNFGWSKPMSTEEEEAYFKEKAERREVNRCFSLKII